MVLNTIENMKCLWTVTHHPAWEWQSFWGRAPSPVESQRGRSQTPQSQTSPGSLRPASCCCSTCVKLHRSARHWSVSWKDSTKSFPHTDLRINHTLTLHVEGMRVLFWRVFHLACLNFCQCKHNTPGQEGLVLLYCVQLVGGGVASLTWQLPLGVVTCTGTWDVDVTAAEVAAALQGRRRRSMSTVDNDTRREEVLILWRPSKKNLMWKLTPSYYIDFHLAGILEWITIQGIQAVLWWVKKNASYLHTDDTAPTTAILAFIYCLITAAQSIESQDSSYTVPN